MFLRTLLRAASAWLIWRWLEPRWRSTLALVVGWWLITVLHAEYVEYVRLTESTDLLWLSYLIKWLLVLSGIAAWVWFSLLGPATPAPAKAGDSPVPDVDAKLTPQTGDDGFDFLRHKDVLEGRGDQVLHAPPKEVSAARESGRDPQ